MNKTVIFIVFGCLAALALVGITILSVFRPESVGALVNNAVTILGLVSVAAGTFYQLGKTNDTVQEIKTQTNGTLSVRDAEIKRLTNIIIAHKLDPITGEDTTPRGEHSA